MLRVWQHICWKCTPLLSLWSLVVITQHVMTFLLHPTLIPFTPPVTIPSVPVHSNWLSSLRWGVPCDVQASSTRRSQVCRDGRTASFPNTYCTFLSRQQNEHGKQSSDAECCKMSHRRPMSDYAFLLIKHFAQMHSKPSSPPTWRRPARPSDS